ncbi:hypothetical protein G9C98_000666 [Cotesia typhae]|uniref:B box-type domain-containing protein n=1 Tax=Cotesia typhae TaxID=2053667 RepID=A0A8J5VBU9_9HYME|nr:hypothetical protein G9C98_000666 [Cotesia typhae]
MNGQNSYSHFRSFMSNSETINNDLGLQIPIVNVSPIAYENHQISNRSASYSPSNGYLSRDSPSSLSPPETGSSNRSSFSYSSEISQDDFLMDSLVNGIIECVTFDEDVSSSEVKLPSSNDPQNHYCRDDTVSFCEISSIMQQKNSNEMTDLYSLPTAALPNKFFNLPLLQLLPRMNPTPSLLSFCNIHPDNAIMYCYTCPAIICDMCQINFHDHHLTMELAKASEVAENQSNRALDKIECYISSIESNIQKLSKSSNDISYKAYKVKKNVSLNIKQVVDAVLEREKELYLHIEEIKTAKQTFIKYQQEILRNIVGQLTRIAKAIFEAKNYLNMSGNPENLIAVKEKAFVEVKLFWKYYFSLDQ